MTAIEMIRLVGSEFADVTDETLGKYVEIVRPMVSRKQFGNLYTQALAYLICHKLKMAGHGENPLGDIGSVGVGFSVGSISAGRTSVSFGGGASANLSSDGELALTVYGSQYLQIRRSVIVPIHVSGETIVPVADYEDETITEDESGG